MRSGASKPALRRPLILKVAAQVAERVDTEMITLVADGLVGQSLQ